MLKWLAITLSCITIILFVVVIQPTPSIVGEDGILLHPPICTIGDTQVHYHKAPQKQLWEFGVGLAMALLTSDNTRLIIIDQDNLGKFSPEFQYWLMRHECNHHKLNHLDHNVRQAALGLGGAKLEKEADCAAILDVYDIGFSDDQFDTLFADMSNKSLLFGSVSYKITPNAKALGHDWTLDQRVKFNKQCLNDIHNQENNDMRVKCNEIW